jgi:uncharacterized LabA/DUF88 family protein
MESRPPLGVVPAERIAIFIDGTNFKYATYDSFGMRVDFSKLLAHFSRNSILLRAYYYTGEWDDGAISQFLRLADPLDATAKRAEMERQRDGDRKFWRFLDRNGFRVVRKPVRVFRDAQGDIKVKADLDLELAIDMLTLAERCEKQILISGDGDFVPLVHAVAARGVRVAVVSTQHEEAYRNGHYRASDDLLDAADEFISIESIRPEIERDWHGPATGRVYQSGPGAAGAQGDSLSQPARPPEPSSHPAGPHPAGPHPAGPHPVVSPAAAAAVARFSSANSIHPGPGTPLIEEPETQP